MRFGKREQIVGLGIFTIATIGLLHVMVFGPRAEEFIKVQEDLEAAERKGEGVALLDRPQDLVAFRNKTERVKEGFDDVLTSLSLFRPRAFYEPTLESVVVPEIEDRKIPAAKRAEMLAELKAARLKELKRERLEEQIQLVFGEIRKLRDFTPKEESGSSRAPDRFPFLQRSWRVPLDLPEGGKGARLRDNLREALGTLEIVAMVGSGQTQLRDSQMRQFAQKIRDIGINNSIYNRNDPNSLAAQGQFVPYIHKLSLAMMLEEELEKSKDVGGEEIGRAKLYELIEFHLPQEPLQANSIEDDLGISDFYFLYESLHFLNSLLGMAVEFDVPQIATLRMGDPSYLSELETPLPWSSEGPRGNPAPTPVAISPYTHGKEKRTQLALLPADESLGYCIPYDFQFRAKNDVGWRFLYAVLERFRLAEIDELKISSIASSESGELNWRVRILHVPLLLATDEEPPPEAEVAEAADS